MTNLLKVSLIAGLALGFTGFPIFIQEPKAIAQDFRAASLDAGGTLSVNEYVPYTINDKEYMLLLQGDGNLVLYLKKAFFDGRGAQAALWNSGTSGKPIEFVSYRNGKLQFYSPNRNLVHKIDIGSGSEVCIRGTSRPVGCN